MTVRFYPYAVPPGSTHMPSLRDWVMRRCSRECYPHAVPLGLGTSCARDLYPYVVPNGTGGDYWSTLMRREDMATPPLIMRST
jgi:hypothetical protein